SICHRRIFLATVILLGLWDAAPAQWKNLAPNLVRAHQYYGAMHYKDGIIWAGSEDLWSSKDTGKTWTRVSSFFIPGDVIRDIAFSDRNIGVICTNGGGIYITRNGGATWNMSWPTPYCWRIAIHRSSNTMYAAVGKDTLNVLTSFDEGVTWVPQTISGRVQTMSIGVDGSVFVLSYEGTAAKVSASTNRGATWSQANGPVDFDSYSLEVDSCDNRQFYIINEDYASSNNGLSEIYSSTDAGATWRVSFSQPVNYLAGSAASSKNVQYVPTLSNGVLRSTDRGRSWKNIGGPGNVADSRNICAINDNTIFVLDPFGSIWATFNSGADSLPAFPSTG
ncbi:MAG TPA: YCF48-related protein, partial [Saprospiraceae bacterium]|nr:YCF48-related protein [Saprospiraceae bacterium]